MALSPVINTVAALEVDPPGSEEGGKTSIPVSVGGGGGDNDGGDNGCAWSALPLPPSSATAPAELNSMGKSTIAIHLAIGSAEAVVPASGTHVGRHSRGNKDAMAGEAMTSRQNSESGTSSTSILCGGAAPVEMDTMRRPRMYIAPLTAAARQNPCAISPVPP